MVQAILDRRKTKTRRLKGLEFINDSSDDFTYQYFSVNDDGLHLMKNNYGATNAIKCPYGNPGDVLWVRETFSPFSDKPWDTSNVSYKTAAVDANDKRWNWKPSIHMPKAVARIWLEVTDVRIEKLQDITEKDAIAEGASDTLKINDFKLLKGLGNWTIPSPFLMHQFGFLSLWCQINGCASWIANPWVWVISFKVLSTTGKPL